MHGLRFSVLTAVLAIGCVTPAEPAAGAESPILGGDSVSVGQFPSVVAVLNSSLCTGTLVAPDLVLTAAHCLDAAFIGYDTQADLTADTYVIFDSANIYGADGFAIAAVETVPHPEFDIDALGTHDIGVIRLAFAVDDRAPSPINRRHEDAPVGLSATLIGFGLTNPWYQLSSGRLFVLTDKLSDSCEPNLGSNDDLICFDQTDGSGSCSGDSGGPAFVQIGGVRTVAGVTSFGDRNCRYFGAYTRTDAELPFLEAFLPEPGCVLDGVCEDGCAGAGLAPDPDCSECLVDSDCGIPARSCVAGECVDTPLSLGDAGAPGPGLDAGAEGDAGEACDGGPCDGGGSGGCDVSGRRPAPTGGGVLVALGLAMALWRRRRSPG